MKFNHELLAIDLVTKRAKLKLNLRQTAKEIGISYAQLNRYERIKRNKCIVIV